MDGLPIVVAKADSINVSTIRLYERHGLVVTRASRQ